MTTTKPVKQVIVMRKDLKMRRGKECAQAGHAAILWLADRCRGVVCFSAAEAAWLHGNMKKICCIANSEEELLELRARAIELGIIVHLVTDSGLTEFDGVPTRTCIAIGPDYEDRVDAVTSKLKLY